MYLLRTYFISALVALCSISTFAAHCCDGHSTNHYGFYVGTGGSYNTVEYDAHMINTPSVRNSAQKFAPVVQLGYYGELNCGSCFRWGVNVFYKYLDFENTPYGVNGLGTSFKMTNEYGAIARVGHTCRCGTFYGGIGATWFNQEFGYSMDEGMRSKCEDKFGLSLQAGFTYSLDCGVFVDLNYTYHHVPESTFSIAENVKAKACVTVQEIMITLNKSFDLF